MRSSEFPRPPSRRRTGWGRRTAVALVGALALAAATTGVAAAAPATTGFAAFLDLTPGNSDAERAGGLDPRLPTDPGALEAALTAARAAGVAPTRYAALLHQFWLARGAVASGIDLAGWDPNAGFLPNATLVERVYANYGRYQRERAELNWAGMAGMAGGSFAAGFWDLDMGRTVVSVDAVHRLGTAVAGVLAALPAQAAAALPADVRALAASGPATTADDLDWYQRRLLIMQKHIYFDMVPMHEAYLTGGRPAIEELDRAGLLDDNARAAWHGIFAGTRDGLDEATRRMADREQNQVVAAQWDATAAGRDGIGRVLSYVTTIAAQPAIPGARAPGVVAPLTVTGDGFELRAPLPDFNWADRAPRWQYIADDTAVAYARLVADGPGRAQGLLARPFRQFMDEQRILRRVPDLARDAGIGWSLTREP